MDKDKLMDWGNDELLAWARTQFHAAEGDIARQVELAKVMATCLQTKAVDEMGTTL